MSFSPVRLGGSALQAFGTGVHDTTAASGKSSTARHLLPHLIRLLKDQSANHIRNAPDRRGAGRYITVPGHGPSRLADTFILSLVFAWMTLRYTLFAPLVTHCIFDAVMTMSLSKIPSIPANEVTWLADRFTLLNSTWSITLLLWLASIPVVVLVRRRRLARSFAPVAVT